MQNEVKISHVQLAAILAVSTVFTSAAAMPSTADYSMWRFVTLTLSTLIIFAIYSPLFVFARKNEDSAFKSVGKVSKWLFGSVMILQLLFIALNAMLQLKFFIRSTIMPVLSPTMFTAVVFFTVLYGMHKGIQAFARIAPLILAFFVLVIALMSFMVWENVQLVRLQSFLGEQEPNEWLRVVFDDVVVKNNEIFFFAALSGFVRGRENNADNPNGKFKGLAQRSVLYYLPFALITGLWLNFLCNVILGRFTDNVMYPIYTISTFTNFHVIERMDGFYVTAGILSGLLKITVALMCVKVIVFELVGKSKLPSAVTASALWLGVCVATILLLGNEEFVTLGKLDVPLGISLLAVSLLMPVAAWIYKRRVHKNEKTSAPTS